MPWKKVGHTRALLWLFSTFIHSFIALHIRPTDLELINRDEGVAIPECWQPVLDHATTMGSTHATPRHAEELMTEQ